MVGPSGSAYENGTFVLFVELGDQFPMRPPSARFKTPVLHPNVTKVQNPAPFLDNSNMPLSMEGFATRFLPGSGKVVSMYSKCYGIYGASSFLWRSLNKPLP